MVHTPSVWVRVYFRSTLLYLMFYWSLIYIFINPKLPVNGCIYILTVCRVLTTNVFLGQLLFRATLKIRLGMNCVF